SGGPLGAWASMPISRAVRENFAKGFDAAQKKNPAPVKTAEERELINRLVELLQTNFDMDEFDGGVRFRRAAGGGPASPLASLRGLKVREGKAFDAWFREAVTKIKPEGETVKFTLDAAKLADGTPIHELTPLNIKEDKNFARVFGKPTLSFAFTGDAILGAF